MTHQAFINNRNTVVATATTDKSITGMSVYDGQKPDPLRCIKCIDAVRIGDTYLEKNDENGIGIFARKINNDQKDRPYRGPDGSVYSYNPFDPF